MAAAQNGRGVRVAAAQKGRGVRVAAAQSPGRKSLLAGQLPAVVRERAGPAWPVQATASPGGASTMEAQARNPTGSIAPSADWAVSCVTYWKLCGGRRTPRLAVRFRGWLGANTEPTSMPVPSALEL